jgi:hypothetical protein
MAKNAQGNGGNNTALTNPTLDFLVKTKEDFKDNNNRQVFDDLLREIDVNLVNTRVQKRTIDQSEPRTVLLTVPRGNGNNDFVVLPRLMNQKGSESNTPRAEVPIAFSKIIVAASALFSSMPDGKAYSVNKLKARTFYELWKRSWAVVDMNGANTIDYSVQQMLTTGTGVFRIYPKQSVIDRTVDIDGKKVKTKKIIYDDIYREPLDMSRTWLGSSYRPWSDDNRPEILWEIDITKEEYKKLKTRFKKRAPKGAANPDDGTVSEEALAEDPDKGSTHVTLSFYENPRENRYIMASSDVVFYDGEMPNQEIYGQAVVMHCMHKNMNTPYGVGFYELIRGNQAIQDYIQSLTVEQVAAEIIPIIFATGNIQGDMTFQRSSTKLNVLPNGVKVDKLAMTGNSTLGMNMIERMRAENDAITGINDIVSGVSGAKTLGETVLLKEAALARLIKPRNSLARALEKDFCIFASWLEQDQKLPREFLFSSEDQVKAFDQVNPMFHNEEVEEIEQKDEYGNPIPKTSYTVKSSLRVPLSFDFNEEDLNESGFEDQNITELGDSSRMISRSNAISRVMDYDEADKIGYDKVYLVIDSNSMLIPSPELQKQVSMQLYPMIQQAIGGIFTLANQGDVAQARAQLRAFTSFLEDQKLDIYGYIPKDLYDQLMIAEPPAPEMMPSMPMGEEGMPKEDLAPNNIPIEQSYNGAKNNPILNI